MVEEIRKNTVNMSALLKFLRRLSVITIKQTQQNSVTDGEKLNVNFVRTLKRPSTVMKTKAGGASHARSHDF